jgi:hypothetical protein
MCLYPSLLHPSVFQFLKFLLSNSTLRSYRTLQSTVTFNPFPRLFIRQAQAITLHVRLFYTRYHITCCLPSQPIHFIQFIYLTVLLARHSYYDTFPPLLFLPPSTYLIPYFKFILTKSFVPLNPWNSWESTGRLYSPLSLSFSVSLV